MILYITEQKSEQGCLAFYALAKSGPGSVFFRARHLEVGMTILHYMACTFQNVRDLRFGKNLLIAGDSQVLADNRMALNKMHCNMIT